MLVNDKRVGRKLDVLKLNVWIPPVYIPLANLLIFHFLTLNSKTNINQKNVLTLAEHKLNTIVFKAENMSSITSIINNYKMCFKSWLLIRFVMMFDRITTMSTHWAIRCCQRTSESIIKLLYHLVYLIDALCILKTLYFQDHRSYGFGI